MVVLDKTFTVDGEIVEISPTWSYREHELNLTASPQSTFQVESASPKRYESITGPPGICNNYIFKSFKKSEITGSEVSIVWDKSDNCAECTSQTFRVIDGNYDKDSLTDFVPGAGAPTPKGASVLGSFSGFDNHAESKETLTGINWGSSVLPDVTIIAFMTDTNTTPFGTMHVRSISVQGAPNTSFTWKFDDTTGTPPVVTNETTGTKQDAGYVNASVTIEAPEETFTIDGITTAGPTRLFLIDAFLQRKGVDLCAGTGAPRATFTEDFTTDTGWTYTGGSPTQLTVDSGSFPDVLRIECLQSTAQGGDQHIEKSLGTTINENDSQEGDIVWEFDHIHVNSCGGFKGNGLFVISATDTHYASNLSQAGLVFSLEPSAPFGSGDPQNVRVKYSDGTTEIFTSTITLTSFTTFFPRVTKTKTGTLKLEVFSDSGRTTQISGSPVSVDVSTLDNKELKFIQFCSVGGGGGSRLLRGSLDNVLLVENVGCPSSLVDSLVKALDVEFDFTVDGFLVNRVEKTFLVDAFIQSLGEGGLCSPDTFQDDFSTYANQGEADAVWGRTGADIIVDFSAEEVDAIFKLESSIDAIAHDLGAGNVSDTSWRLRFKFDIIGVSPSNTSTKFAMLGITDTNHGVSPTSGNQNGIFVRFDLATDTDLVLFRFANNANLRTGTQPGSPFSTVTTSVATYFIEITRTSASTAECSVYSDSGFTTLIEKVEIDQDNMVGTTDLRYIKFYNADDGSTTGQITTKIDDVEFRDGEATIPIGNVVCSRVDGIVKALSTDKTFLVNSIIFTPPAKLFLINALLDGEIEKTFNVDSCIRVSTAVNFEVDACLQRTNIKTTFDVDGHVFILPVRNALVDAIVRYSQGVSLRGGIPDLIVRVLRDNGSLTGRGIVDEIVIVTTADPTISFTGKNSRIKNWLNRLRLDGLIQEDGSDPDWFETIWSLV